MAWATSSSKPDGNGGSEWVNASDKVASSGFFDNCGWRNWISVSISAS